jgi:hypothetical protein
MMVQTVAANVRQALLDLTTARELEVTSHLNNITTCRMKHKLYKKKLGIEAGKRKKERREREKERKERENNYRKQNKQWKDRATQRILISNLRSSVDRTVACSHFQRIKRWHKRKWSDICVIMNFVSNHRVTGP